MFKAAENAEDKPDAGIDDLKERDFCNKDILIGISASGSAAYVISAVIYAKSIGVKAFSITNNTDTEPGKAADVDICADTGAEVITGSNPNEGRHCPEIIFQINNNGIFLKIFY